MTDDHLPAVVALCRAALDLPEDAAEAEVIVTRVRETGALPGSAGPRAVAGFVAVAGDAPVGVVLGSTGHADPSAGHVDLFAVDPAHRRRGIGRALLTRMEAALAALGATEVLLAGNPPHYAWPGIDVRYTPAVCAALALGYTQDRTAWNMTADLSYDDSPALRSTTAGERRLAEAGISVRRAGPDDLDAVVRFATANFGPAWGAEVTDSIAGTRAGCHIAVRATEEGGDEVLGFASYGSSRPSWFGPMGTADAAQGLGIGGVLLRRCLRDQRDEGHRRAEIGWVGPVPFYAGAAGARIERVFFLYRKPLTAG
ncbi:GNAT family N-acetyltransferase [Micromonospora sp. NPDC049559]|uniref:GNAT family N-acetyltransferase n=1 Tax=Micromonospora sp. NPDC049559 TaxID=3155923 RepID=UPI0034316199